MLTVKYICSSPVLITAQLIWTLHVPFCAPVTVISQLVCHGQEFSAPMGALAGLPGDLSDKQHLLRHMTVTELSALPAFAKAEQGNTRRPLVCLLISSSSPGQKETKKFNFLLCEETRSPFVSSL